MFMYGIATPDNKPYMDEFCVCSDAGELECVVDDLNEMQCEGGGDYRVVPLYAATPTITVRLPELHQTSCSESEKYYWPADVIEAIRTACEQADINVIIAG